VPIPITESHLQLKETGKFLPARPPLQPRRPPELRAGSARKPRRRPWTWRPGGMAPRACTDTDRSVSPSGGLSGMTAYPAAPSSRVCQRTSIIARPVGKLSQSRSRRCALAVPALLVRLPPPLEWPNWPECGQLDRDSRSRRCADRPSATVPAPRRALRPSSVGCGEGPLVSAHSCACPRLFPRADAPAHPEACAR